MSRLTLNFDPKLCEECETFSCLVECQYINWDINEIKQEKKKLLNMEDNEIIKECVTCYSCEEYCPYNNHPFYQITEVMERLDYYPVPKPVLKSQIKAFAPRGDLKPYPVKEPVINMCLFPNMIKTLKGELFENVSIIVGSDIFCNLVYLHFGRPSVVKERIERSIENIYKTYLEPYGIKELICYHDECYGTYTHWAPAYGIDVPFKPVHLFEYLYNKLLEMKDKIKPLGIRVAYQRPCSSKLHNTADLYVDKIFELIGVERVNRKYDRENSLCCGGVMEAHQKFDLTEEIQEENVEDMKAHKADVAVFNCPFCHWTLSEMVAQKGIKPLMLYDLCRMAIGEF